MNQVRAVLADEDAPTVRGQLTRARSDVLKYRWPLLFLLLAFPLTLYAIVTSCDQIGRTFPGFFVMENAVVPTVSGFDWPPDRNALFHRQIVSADGVLVRSSADVYEHAAARGVGAMIEYGLRAPDGLRLVQVESMRFGVRDYLESFGVLLLFGCSWLVFGLVVGFLQPGTAQARAYLIQGMIAGLYPITAVFLYVPGHPILTQAALLLERLFPATWIYLAFFFPVVRDLRGMHRIWPIAPFAISLVLHFFVLRGFYANPPDLSALYATYLFGALSFLFFIGSLLHAFRLTRDAAVRARVKAVLPGASAAGTLAFFALTDSASAGRNFPVQFGLLLTPFFTAGVAWAIARHDLFDIDRIVRQSFVYAVLSVIVIGTYALLLVATSRIAPAGSQPMAGMAFVVLVALVLDPVRRNVQSLVDRAFYRDRLDYKTTIADLSEAMTSLLDLHEVIDRVTAVPTDSMRLESATVCLLRQDDHEGGVWLRQADGILQRSDSPDCLAALAAAAMATAGEFRGAMLLQKISTPAERERAGSFLDRIGAAILLPVVFRDEPVGLLALGTKRSGQPFDSDDLTLLRTLAHQTAIALQNARSYAALEDLTRHLDAKVQRQTEELRTSNEELSSAYESLKNAQSQLIQSEKMASLGQLVAGVAHELNNPASFVHGGLANLQEHLDQFVSVIETYEQIARRTPAGAEEVEIVRRETDLGFFLRETPQLLRICSEGSERIKAIVEDLRVFVRAEKGERTPTRVVDGIDSTLRLLSNRLDGITLRKDYEDAPAIQAHPAHLNQVWMNLLSNAIDAVEGVRQPEVHVSLRYANGHGSETPLVEVQIRDNGCGVGTDDLRRVFDPFFTTKPVGRGTGLGLSIVFGIVKSHGGSIRVESEPGNGTTMTVHLPVRS